jgi:DNA polymerase III epsilon subunit-like protein
MNKKMDNIIIDIETSGLDPIESRILAIGIVTLSDGEKVEIFMDQDEKKILSDFWEFIRKQRTENTRLIGYNIDGFDWNFLKIRSLKHNLKVNYFDRFKERVDLMRILSPVNQAWKRLDDWCDFLDIEKKSLLTGADMTSLDLNNSEHKTMVIEHLKDDLEKTKKLFYRMLDCGLIK